MKIKYVDNKINFEMEISKRDLKNISKMKSIDKIFDFFIDEQREENKNIQLDQIVKDLNIKNKKNFKKD